MLADNKLIIGLIFTFFFLVYITSSSGHFDPWDSIEYFFITESMVVKHSVKLYPDLPTLQALSTHSSPVKPIFKNSCTVCDLIVQPTYTARALVAPAIAVPFYYAALFFSASPLTVIALFTNSFIISLVCVILYCFSEALYNSKKIAFVLTLIFGLCSFIWPYNNSLLSEPSQTLCIFASAYFIFLSSRQKGIIKTDNNYGISIININKNKAAYLASLGALFLGLSVISHPSNIIIIPGFVAYYIFSIKRNNNRRILLLSYFVVLGGVLLFAGFTNYVRFGSFSKFGYAADVESLSAHHGWEGLIGLLASPGKGLIFYFPIAILLPIALRCMYTKSKGLFFISIYTLVVFWLFFGTLYIVPTQLSQTDIWSGGWWGSRYLLPVLPFITLAIGTLLEHLKGNKRFLKISLIIILCVAGFLVNLAGILVFFFYADVYAGNQGLDQEAMTWNPYNTFIVKHLEVLMSNFASHFKPLKFTITSYTFAPCSYNIFFYCNFGIVPILVLSAIIAVLAAIILIKINLSKPSRLTLKTFREVK